MYKKAKNQNPWKDLRIGVTGINGTLGNAISEKLHEKGAHVIGLTHSKSTQKRLTKELINWNCGEESKLDPVLKTLDILIINHGVNRQGIKSNQAIDESLEVNALSTWRLIKRFEAITLNQKTTSTHRELWVNTSEAEIQPALSPSYEISKRLIGQLVSIKINYHNKTQNKLLTIRKLILGPFKSDLNPIGIMDAGFVASQIIFQAEIGSKLIIVTPNPVTYIAMPITELVRTIYFRLINLLNNKE